MQEFKKIAKVGHFAECVTVAATVPSISATAIHLSSPPANDRGPRWQLESQLNADLGTCRRPRQPLSTASGREA